MNQIICCYYQIFFIINLFKLRDTAYIYSNKEMNGNKKFQINSIHSIHSIFIHYVTYAC